MKQQKLNYISFSIAGFWNFFDISQIFVYFTLFTYRHSEEPNHINDKNFTKSILKTILISQIFVKLLYFLRMKSKMGFLV